MTDSSPDRLQRRAFLGRITVTAGGSLVAGLMPVSLLQAAPLTARCGVAHDPCGDWQLDDMCLAFPPYAFAIDSGVPRAAPMTATVAAVDRNWMMDPL